MNLIDLIKRTIDSIRFSDIFKPVVQPVIYVNIIGGLLILFLSLFVDYGGLYGKLPISELFEYQIGALIFIILFEIIFILSLIARYVRKERKNVDHIEKLISNGENEKVEFKSSLRWDYKEGRVNKDLEYSVAKTLSAFLNVGGGTLIIGVDDDGNVLGIEKDYETLKKKNSDGFLLHFTNVVNTYIGKDSHRFLNIFIDNFSNKDLCVIEAKPSKDPVYINHNGHQEFFIRATSSNQPLEVRDAHIYIKTHWGK